MSDVQAEKESKASRLSWKGIVSVCYFLLTGMLALAVALFFSVASPGREFLLVLVLVIGVTVYASFRAFGLGKKLMNVANASHAQLASVLSILATVVLAWVSFATNNVLLAPIFLGAMGGMIHEIAQSNGKFILPTRDTDGNWYLGGLFGLIAGGVAGLLLAQGLKETTVGVGLVSESFLAGLALKGFADAVAATRPQAAPPKAGGGPA